MKQYVLLASIAVLAACSNPNTQRVSSQAITAEPRETFDAKNVVAAKTANPDAARFTDFQAYALDNGDRVYCGQMDAVTATGTRTGNVPFYIRMRAGVVKSAQWMADKAEFSAKKCAEASKGSIKISPH